MTSKEIADLLSAQFKDKIILSLPEDKHPRVHINAKDWREIATFLSGDARLEFDFLLCLSGLDYVADNQLACVYDLRSTTHAHEFSIKVFVDRDTPAIPSVMDLWPAANWHEREAFDLFGIIFDGHTDLRRILLPEDWEGYPLRKDYLFPREYHGIPGTTELDWQQKADYPLGH